MKKVLSLILATLLILSGCVCANATQPTEQVVSDVENESTDISLKKQSKLVFATGKGYDQSYENPYVCAFFKFSNMLDNRDFERIEILITYNPEVLEYSQWFPFELDAELRNLITCTVTEPGKLQVVGTPNGQFRCKEFDPFCFKVIGEGPTDIAITLVAWQNVDGEVTDREIETHIDNFDALLYETVKPLTAVPTAVLDQSLSGYWEIPANMTVAQFRETSPTDLFEIFNKDGEKLADDDIIGTGCVYKLSFNGQYPTTQQLYVLYDLTGDGQVSVADARQTLRISVGLDPVTKDQVYLVYAAGLRNYKNFTPAVARSVLCHAVGLEP